MKKKILLKAPILTHSGYGEHGRFALRALRAHEELFDIYIKPLNWGQCGWIWRDSEERQFIDATIQKTAQYTQDGGKFDTSVQVTIPNEFENLATTNIGVTAGVETDRIAPQWVEKSTIIDRMVVVSEHAKYGFDNTSYSAENKQTGEILKDFKVTCPITVVNYPVRHFESAEVSDFNPTTNFNFLCVAQWGPRKNLENTIKWFIEEFANDADVGLVLKASVRNNSQIDKYHTEKKLKQLISKLPKHKCRLYLLHGDLSEEQMTFIYQHVKVKCLVSLAHGEGFGLPIFESIYNGLPVICPAWGGQMDFITAPIKNKKTGKVKNKALITKVDYDIRKVQDNAVWDGVIQADSHWCFPKETSYKQRLREVYKDYGRFKAQANLLKRHVTSKLTEAKQYKAFAEAVAGHEITEFNLDELPKISIYTSVFDGADIIEGFLEDITNQTIFTDKCELILIHPKTSPGFIEEKKIIKDYLKKFDNIVYKPLKDDPGTYACWNLGVKASTGAYLTNANLDDRKARNSIERYAKELFTNPDVDVVYADSLITNALNETFDVNTSNGRKYTFPEFSFKNLKMVNVLHQCPLYRRELHDKHGMFEEKYRSASDWEFWLRCASKGTQMKKINEILNIYCFNPKGISTNPENFKWKREEEKEIYTKYKDLEVE